MDSGLFAQCSKYKLRWFTLLGKAIKVFSENQINMFAKEYLIKQQTKCAPRKDGFFLQNIHNKIVICFRLANRPGC